MLSVTGLITIGRVAAWSAMPEPAHLSLRLVQAQAEASNPKPKMTAKRLQISLNAECEVLITNAQGKSIGFDSKKGQVLNEIPQAEIREVPPFPVYLLPADTLDKPYTIRLTGRPASRDVHTDLMVTGGGLVAGCKNLLLTAGKTLTLTVTSDGRRLTFTAGQDEQTPLLFTSTQSGRSNPSYSFEIGGVKLASRKTLAVTLDMEKQRLYFKDNDAKRDNYSVKMRQTNPDGTRYVFLRTDIQLGKADNYMMDFGKWDGKTDMCFYIDDKGDGFDNKACIKVSPQK